MGAGASHQGYQQSVTVLQQELAKKDQDQAVIDTPRGVSAKNEVVRLRELIRQNAGKLIDSQEGSSNQESDDNDNNNNGNNNNIVLTNNHDEIPVGIKSSTRQEDEYPASGSLSPEEDDARVPCEKCSRKFNPDRIDKHRSVCKLIKPSIKQTGKANPVPAATPAKPSVESQGETMPKWKADRMAMREKLKKDRKEKLRAVIAGSKPEQPGDDGELQTTVVA